MFSLTEGLLERFRAERLWAPMTGLIALGLLWSLASGIWFFIGGAETDVAPPVAAPAARTPVERTGAELSGAQIAALNLFGVAGASSVAERAMDAPETRLQLDLQGVFLADVADQSSVIVAERNRDGILYRVGDRLPGNAVLVEVLADRIVLRRAGQLETLKFPDATPGAAFSVETNADTADGTTLGAAAVGSASTPGLAPPLRGRSEPGADAEAAEAGSGAGAGAGAGSEADSEARSLRDTLREYSERLNVDPAGTLAELGVEAIAQDAGGGYRLGSEIPSATLAQVGLRPGDVVLSVNGQAVGDIQQDRSQLDSIVDAGSARLEIQRGDRRFFVTTRIR